MITGCPYCAEQSHYVIDSRTIVRHGGYRRRSDSKYLERFRCKLCRKTFSTASTDDCFGQKKRQKNKAICEHLASGVSCRRTARLLRISRHTVQRKLIFLGRVAKDDLFIQTASSPVRHMQFDDLETFEHSKCKPVSITLAVEEETRRILGFRVSSMGSNGPLVHKALARYGKRHDGRSDARRSLFAELRAVVAPGATIKSDSNPYYVNHVKQYFPGTVHLRFLGRRGAVTGQGELKKIGFDPIFSLNHTCAMFRANVARLIRKTWCTTKKRVRLADHLAIYAVYHNANLSAAARKPHPGRPA